MTRITGDKRASFGNNEGNNYYQNRNYKEQLFTEVEEKSGG